MNSKGVTKTEVGLVEPLKDMMMIQMIIVSNGVQLFVSTRIEVNIQFVYEVRALLILAKRKMELDVNRNT